jgi:hypothetical protein
MPVIILWIMLSTTALADIAPLADLADFGLTEESVRKQRRRHEAQTDDAGIIKRVAESFEADDFMSAVYTDQAMAAIINQAGNVMEHYGYGGEAAKIRREYAKDYSKAYVGMFLGLKEIGDRPPLSKWLDSVHTTIEDSIGEYLCKAFHLHSLYVLNYGIPTVFNPEDHDLKDYLDAFSGHLIWGFFWEHGGVSGTVTYWVVNTACTMGTSGMGVVAFICGWISGYAETTMDGRIAPPIGERIWARAHKDLNVD